MSNSYTRHCRYCGRWISMRQMPAGQWVAFEHEAVHDCAAPAKTSATQKVSRRAIPKSATPKKSLGFDDFDLPNDEVVTTTTKRSFEAPPDSPNAPRVVTHDSVQRTEPVFTNTRSSESTGFGGWLLRFLAIILLFGLVRALATQSMHSNHIRQSTFTIPPPNSPNTATPPNWSPSTRPPLNWPSGAGQSTSTRPPP